MPDEGRSIGQKRDQDAAGYLKAILEFTEEPILICNADGIIAGASRAAEESLGYSAHEIVGKRVASLVLPDHVDEERSIAERVGQGGRVNDYQTQRLCKDGQPIDVFLSVSPVHDHSNNLLGSVHILRRVSDKVELAQSMWSSIVESADDAIVTKNLDGIITSWNPGAERIFGYKAAEVIGKPINVLIPEDQPDEEPRILQRIRRGERIDHYETKRVTKEGDIIDISLTVSPIRDRKGAIVGASKVARDITPRKRLEAREREARRQVEALSRAKDEFIATVSHELRTPMTAILGWVRMLSLGQLNPDAQKKAVQVIERNARSQAQLIEDLLDVSRIISGKLKLKMKRVDPTSIIETVIESLRPTAESRSVRVQMLIDTGVKSVVVDEERFRQVIWNLLSNALKFTPAGGRVRISLESTDSAVRISVSDNGIGIKPEFLPYVFNRFSQADSSITRSHGGLGMGLSIVKSIVELHGGDVSVSSDGEGKGTTFTIRLPLGAPLLREEENESPATPVFSEEPLMYSRDLVGLKLLVVDDEPDTCEMLSFLLERCGAKVQTANSAMQALDALKVWNPDVLICDIGMPTIDGYELIRRIRTDETSKNSRVPAVALTALARIEDRVKALSAGYQMHVAKPIEPVELVSMIASVASLGRHRTS